MNFVDKDGTTKVYIPVHPCLSHVETQNGFQVLKNMQEVFHEAREEELQFQLKKL